MFHLIVRCSCKFCLGSSGWPPISLRGSLKTGGLGGKARKVATVKAATTRTGGAVVP